MALLVHGAAGGVGSLLLDMAKRAGVRTVGTCSAGKLDVVRSRGAEALDHEAGDLVRKVKEISGGGVIAAFDHIGGGHLRRVSMRSLRAGGLAIIYGGYNATRDGRLNLLAGVDLMFNTRLSSYALFNAGQGVVGYSAPIWRDQRPEAYRRDLESVLALVADGSLHPLIGARFALQDAAAAHRALESRSVSGKIVLIPAAG